MDRIQVMEAMSYHHLQIIKKEMDGKSKCESIIDIEKRKMQDFMVEKSLENSRMEVLWLTNKLDTRTTMIGGGGLFCTFSGAHGFRCLLP